MDCHVISFLAMTECTPVIASVSAAIQRVNVSLYGLPRHFIPRNDGMHPVIASVSAAIQKILEKTCSLYRLPRHFIPRNDGMHPVIASVSAAIQKILEKMSHRMDCHVIPFLAMTMHPVIASVSAAIQKILEQTCSLYRLPRHFIPRNDGMHPVIASVSAAIQKILEKMSHRMDCHVIPFLAMTHRYFNNDSIQAYKALQP